MSAGLFAVVVLAGAALLAAWVDFRWPSLAPEGLLGRGLALGAACLVLQIVPLVFERMLALALPQEPRALVALVVLLAGFTFAFISGLWLLRTLRELAALR